MQPNQHIHKLRKKIVLVAAIITSLLIITAAIVAVIILLKPKDNNTTSSSAIITDYIKPGAVAGLSSNLYKQQANTAATITYKINGKDYSIDTKTSDSIIFYALSKDQQDDAETIQSQTAAFMKSHKLTRSNSSKTADSSMITTTYSGDGLVCQTVDSNPPVISGLTRYHEISCITDKAINDEYSAINKLFDIYKKTQKMPSAVSIIRTVNSDKNVSYSVLYVTTKTGQSLLLFATANDNWEYIGDLAAGDSKYASGKYIITPEIKAKISDSKYNGFITKDIH